MTKIQTKKVYSPFADTRRYCDGVRLHEYLGYILMEGGDDLLLRHPDCQISRAEFSRAALPALEKMGLVALIDPTKELPTWLADRERKLARRGGMKPIWMPTLKMPMHIWSRVIPQVRNGQIVLIDARAFETSRKAKPH